MEFISKGCQTLTGYSVEDFLENRSISYGNLIHPQDRDRIWAMAQQAIAQKAPFQFEYRIRMADGSEKWVWERGCGVFHPETTLAGLEGFVTDITERRKTEDSLQSSYAEFNRALEMAHIGHWYWDFEKNKASWSDEMLRMYGFTRESFKDHIDYVIQFIHPEDRSIRAKAIQDLRAGKSFQPFEYRINSLDGKQRLIRVIGMDAHYTQDGTLARVHGITMDITDQKRAELALLDSEIRFRTLIERSPIAIGIAKKGSLLYANPKYVELLEYGHATEILGKPILEMFAPQCRDQMTEIIQNRIQGLPAPNQYETIAFTRRGKQFPVLASISQTIWGQDGLVTMGFFTDLTESKQMERQLAQAQRLTAIGTLAAGIAHEINNPNMFIMLSHSTLESWLRNILSALDAPLEERESFLEGESIQQVSGIITKSLQSIEEGSTRIKNIVAELKDFARDKPLEAMEEVNMNTVIQSAVTLTTHKLKTATDNFLLQQEEAIPYLRGNAQKLEQVMVNLLVNACDAMKDRKKSIVVASRFDPVRDSIIVQVRDEGIGMSNEILQQVGTPFFTTKRNSGGTGLGASISSRIMEEHGGFLDYESTPGIGTMVTMVIPRQGKN